MVVIILRTIRMFQLQWFSIKHYLTETCIICYGSDILVQRILETLKKKTQQRDVWQIVEIYDQILACKQTVKKICDTDFVCFCGRNKNSTWTTKAPNGYLLFFSMPAQLIGKGPLFFASQMVRERELKALQDISQRHV